MLVFVRGRGVSIVVQFLDWPPKVKEMIPTKVLCVEIHNVMCISLTFNAHKLHFRPFDNINQ